MTRSEFLSRLRQGLVGLPMSVAAEIVAAGGEAIADLSDVSTTEGAEGLVAAAIDAVQKYGVGSGAVRTISGTMEMHMELERRLAAFKQTEAVVVFQSGFAANAGTVSSILGKEDFIISDELNHASIIDGVRLSKAKRFRYRNNDMDDLETRPVEGGEHGGGGGAAGDDHMAECAGVAEVTGGEGESLGNGSAGIGNERAGHDDGSCAVGFE